MFTAVKDEFLIFAEDVKRKLLGPHDDNASAANLNADSRRPCRSRRLQIVPRTEDERQGSANALTPVDFVLLRGRISLRKFVILRCTANHRLVIARVFNEMPLDTTLLQMEHDFSEASRFGSSA